jgi:anti-sigma-K factor RskA
VKNHQNYADDLALYVLGELEPAQSAEVRAHIEDCAECRREYQTLNADMAALALSTYGPAAPARSRERLMRALNSESRRAGRVTGSFRVRPRWWALAPVFSTALLAMFAILLWIENSEMRDELSKAHAQRTEQSKDLERANMMMAAMSAPDAMHVTLVSANTKPQPQVKVFYAASKGALMLTASNVEAIPAGKSYELWLIPMNGSAPMPAGMFRPDARGGAMLVMPQMPGNMQAKAFAITVEPEGGSESPTMPIRMLGAASP